MSHIGASKIILRNKFTKYKLYDVKINYEEWITELKLLRGYIKKLDVHIDDSEMTTHIILNLPE